MNERIEYNAILRTSHLVHFLVGCPDQVASTKDVADHFDVSPVAARNAFMRLAKVGRVEEISPNLWHLE